MLYYLNVTLATNTNNTGSTSSEGGNAPSGASNLYPTQDIDGAGLVDTNATTQFVSDKNVVSGSRLNPTDFSKIVYDSSSDMYNQEIKDFLGKPIVVSSGTFKSTDTYSTIGAMPSPYNPFNPPSTLLIDKLNGYLGFRATTVYRLVVNATRFQQGRYALSYINLGGADSAITKTERWINDHMATLVQRTTMPHVELDLCCDTEATLRIPYNSALNFFPMGAIGAANKYGTWGYAHLWPYVPISAASGSLEAGYTVYMHFEDVELIVAALPQSGRVFGKVRRKNETEAEQDSAGIGPISSTLIKVRDASTIFAKVPLLSSYANTVSWFADLGASAAKVFGWSKPITLAASTRVTQNYLPYATNTDGPDASFPLSLSYNNQVGMARGFSGTDVDEMDFSFLATIPVWMKTVPWTAGAASGFILNNTLVSAAGDYHTTVVNTQTFNHFSPLQFIANHFFYWRGSIVYKIKLVKTEFHSGRLIVAFSPQVTESAVPADVTLASSSYLHRQIIDIRETNEFTFVIPFVSETPWQPAFNGNAIGKFVIIVLDPLVAPDNVNSEISIIIEKAGGPDIQFATPAASLYSYYSGIIPQSGDPFGSVATNSTICSNLDSSIGTSLIKSDQGVNALNCIGESITSFRTLLKLPNYLIYNATPTISFYLNVAPFTISAGSIVGITNTAPVILSDLYSRVASCYTYSRGGVRIKFLDNMAVTTTTPIAVSLLMVNGNTVTKNTVLSWSSTNANGVLTNVVRNNTPVLYYRAGYSGEVQVPQYHKTHSRVNSDCVGNPQAGIHNTDTGLAPRVFLSRQTIPPSNTADTAVLRSISDDANFGSFLSVPPMIAVLT